MPRMRNNTCERLSTKRDSFFKLILNIIVINSGTILFVFFF
jgi:hypothetical protein